MTTQSSVEFSVGNSSSYPIFPWRGFSAAYLQRTFIREIILNLTIAIYFFAIPANAAIILIFSKTGFKSTSNISFLALAVADLIVSIAWIPILINFSTFKRIYTFNNYSFYLIINRMVVIFFHTRKPFTPSAHG